MNNYLFCWIGRPLSRKIWSNFDFREDATGFSQKSFDFFVPSANFRIWLQKACLSGKLCVGEGGKKGKHLLRGLQTDFGFPALFFAGFRR